MACRTLSAVVTAWVLTIILELVTANTEECDRSSTGDRHTCQAETPSAVLADSLLQTKFNREAGESNVHQSPALCDGITSVGKCWYLSAVGQNCETTCSARGLLYSFAAPKHDMVPLLLGHSPQGILDPWLHVECYLPSEDRYHPYNPSAWGVPGSTPAQELWKAGQYTSAACQLACPCGFQYQPPAVIPPTPPPFPVPTPAPTPVSGYVSDDVLSCTGIEAYGRCWYLSARGASCDETCAAYACGYNYAYPVETMVPKLIGHEPSGRDNPWSFLECYVAKEDRYHPADPNAWGTPGKTDPAELVQAGKYTHDNCRLSCPCTGQCRGFVPTPAPWSYATPAPTPAWGYGQVETCRGVVADGACWYLSETGQDCDTTCSAQGTYYSFAAPSDDIIPKLVGHKPSARNNPWLFLECYVPLEDRYHPFNKNAWGVPEKTPPEELPEAGQHTYPTCQLACPCALRSDVVPPVRPTLPPVILPPVTLAPTAEPGDNDQRWTHISHQGTNGGTGYVTGAETTKKPTPGPFQSYGGIKAVGREWFMSGTGESCAATCSRYGLSYSWAEPPKDRPMTPRLLGYQPGNKQWPWAFLECYVASEDRYHTVNTKAWGVPDKTPQADLGKAAHWTDDTCQLACPCAAKVECGWVQPPACAPEFEYKGLMYSGCPTVDHDGPWCMHHHHHSGKEFYQYEWSYCINTCETPGPKETCSWKQAPSCVNEFDYEGIHYVGCTTIDHDTPWCSNTDPYTGSWAHCIYDCQNPSAEDQKRIEEINKGVEADDTLCSWRPAPECSVTFSYKGFDYEGCALFVDHPMPWCSHDRVHNGKWSQCERFCTTAVR